MSNSATWPGKTLTIYNNSRWNTSVTHAVTDLNKVGMNIKLQLTNDPSKAQVMVSDVTHFTGGCAASGVVGRAPQGYKSDRKSWVHLTPLKRGKDRGQNSQVIMHELGHVLGLGHRTGGCQLMNPEMCEPTSRFVADKGCPINDRFGMDPDEWCSGVRYEKNMCGPTKPEAEKLISMYGGKLRSDYTAWCHKTVIQSWVSDCAYPQWHAKHNIFPMPLTPDGKSCAKQTPRWGWEPLLWAQKASRTAWRRHPSQQILKEIHRLDHIARLCPRSLCLGPFLAKR